MNEDNLWGRCYQARFLNKSEVKDSKKEQDMTYSHKTDPTKNGYEAIRENSAIMGHHKIFDTTDTHKNKSLYANQKAALANSWRESLHKVNTSETKDAAPQNGNLSAYERQKAALANAWRKSK